MPPPTPPAPPPRRRVLDRLRRLDALGALRRLVALAALVIILITLAYASLPFTTRTATLVRTSCSPAVVQVFDRGRLAAPAQPGGAPGPPITAAPAGAPAVKVASVLTPCTNAAKRRLYYAVPIIVLVLVGSAGLRRILA